MDTNPLALRPLDDADTLTPVAQEVTLEESNVQLPEPLVAARSRRIGHILVDEGRLTRVGLERILAEQQITNKHFGEIGIQLGLLQREDVEYALAKQFRVALLPKESLSVSLEVHTAFQADGEVVTQTRALRSQLKLRWLDCDDQRRTVAITSAERGTGRSFVAANLAVSFAQLRSGGRTLLIDADLVRPRQHQLFGLDNRVGLSTVLAGLTGRESLNSVPGLPGLRVMTAGPQPPNCDDLLARSSLGHLIEYLTPHFKVILIDSPPWEEGEAAKSLAAAAGAALMVVRPGQTLAASGARIAREMQERRATLVGVVMNENARWSAS